MVRDAIKYKWGMYMQAKDPMKHNGTTTKERGQSSEGLIKAKRCGEEFYLEN